MSSSPWRDASDLWLDLDLRDAEKIMQKSLVLLMDGAGSEFELVEVSKILHEIRSLRRRVRWVGGRSHKP